MVNTLRPPRAPHLVAKFSLALRFSMIVSTFVALCPPGASRWTETQRKHEWGKEKEKENEKEEEKEKTRLRDRPGETNI